jgi:hypothetical protein
MLVIDLAGAGSDGASKHVPCDVRRATMVITHMRCLQKEAPQEVLDALQLIETRADECFKTLNLLKMPRNQAVWAVLTGAISRIEAEMANHGDNNARFDTLLLNLSRLSTIAIEWTIKYGKPASALIKKWRWNPGIQTSIDEAVAVVQNYDAFLTCFPMWHKNRYLAEVLTPSCARFIASGGSRERQVSAYQKGFRPSTGRFKSVRPTKPDQDQDLRVLFDNVLEACHKQGLQRFKYADAPQLWSALLPEYRKRVNGICRRADSVDLGDYTLAEFKEFYVGLLAVCAAHEHLCFRWMQLGHDFPFDSAVLINQRSRWVRVASDLTGVPAQKCARMIDDLTLGVTRSTNLHVHPFVPTDASSQILALAPQFPLHSRVDENILQTCSRLRPAVYDATTLEKEEEMRTALKGASRFRVEGPATLPQPLPDVDLIIEDSKSSTAIIAEMKWARKPTRPIESVERDADVLKGVKQLKLIQDFLRDHPDHIRVQGRMSESLTTYRHLHYLLVARDHLLWVEPTNDIAIVEFDAFSRILTSAEDLHSGIVDLLSYDWLPVEGRDFAVRFERAVANAVAIESEVFYSK